MTNTGKITTAQWLSIISCGLPRALFARQTVGCLLWAAILLIQPFPSKQMAHATTPSTVFSSPEFARYPDLTVDLSGDSTVPPDVPPSGATAINVSISTNFQGMLTADPITGVVRVTNAHPAGTYSVTVHADIRGVPSISAFKLIVKQGKSCAAGPGFTPTADRPQSNSPVSVAVGDFNNDGKQDLAIGSAQSHSVSIQLGDGLGGFSRATEVILSDWPTAIAIGDFNNDGDQDFVTTNFNSNSVSIRLGDGLGGFRAKTSDIYVGDYPTSVAVGDFNNDGKQDLAVVCEFTSGVAVRFGDGLGGFDGNTTVDVNGYSVSVAIGDFDRDGNQDLATANYSSNNVCIRFGDGSGGFRRTTNIDVGNTPVSIAIGDFNNDGNQDFATANFLSHNVSIRLGDGTGGFNALPFEQVVLRVNTAPEHDVGDSSRSVVIGDFNNDGNQDFATANQDEDSVSISLGNGQGAFDDPANISTGDEARSVAIGDFNSDGIQDFATVNYDNVSIHLGGCGAAISFGELPDKVYGEADFTVSATSSSGLSVSFQASGTCTVSGNMVHLTGADKCTITALQPGDPYHESPSNVSRAFTVFKAVTTTSVVCADYARQYTGLPWEDCVARVTGPGLDYQLTVKFANNINAGQAIASASFAGNANYLDSKNSSSFTINPAGQTIAFGELPTKKLGDADFTVSAKASSDLAVSFKASGNCTIAGTTVHLTDAGSCTISAFQAGDSNYYAAAPVKRTFSISAPAK